VSGLKKSVDYNWDVVDYIIDTPSTRFLSDIYAVKLLLWLGFRFIFCNNANITIPSICFKIQTILRYKIILYLKIV